MSIDINWIRQDRGGDPQLFRHYQELRFKDPTVVDRVLELDNHWRQLRFALEQLQKQYNEVSEVVKQKKIASKGQDLCEEEVTQLKQLEAEIKLMAPQEAAASVLVKIEHRKIGNSVHSSVPVSQDEANNRIERSWGEPSALQIDNTPGHYYHYAVLARLDGYDPVRGVKLVGHRGYLLKGSGLLLNQALINYALNFLAVRHYTPLQPPFLLKKSMMGLTAELADFDEQLYRVNTGDETGEGFYLIATSEQPLSCMHQGEWLNPKELPLRYAGYSSCFRKEAGAHGKETWGVFRVHQFEKVEQFCITTPENSWDTHEEMIRTAEAFYQSLGLPYRVVTIVSGELNNAAAKKYDLEAWFPGYGTYRELVSCSNCTDYQARAAEVRCGVKKQNDTEKKYVHMLNATLCATERTLCCLLENYQTEEGFVVPEVLRPYMQGVEFITFKRELTKDELKGK